MKARHRRFAWIGAGVAVLGIAAILGAMMLGGFFALLVRIELFTPGLTIVGQDWYNKFFTLHGAVQLDEVFEPLEAAPPLHFLVEQHGIVGGAGESGLQAPAGRGLVFGG